jgi:cytochrome c553
MYRCLFTALLVGSIGCGNDVGLLGGPDGGAGASTGLPCDVEAAISQCQSCHGSPLAGNAPIRLLTYDDLTRSVGGVTIAERAVTRMTATTSPMPPAPASPASGADIAAVQSWIAAGLPRGDCGSGSNPFDTPPVCTSGRTWTGGNSESPLMHPGAACIACHRASFEGPLFTIAGTVYPTGHEPTDCYGATGPVSVEVTDAANVTHTLPVNSAGNFYYEGAIQFPFRAKVIANGLERVMVGAQTDGECNSCHTQSGASMAPGRIVTP